MEHTRIDNINQVNLSDLTYACLNMRYGTGRGRTEKRNGEKRNIYRHGVATELGDIEISLWQRLVLMLIERESETELFLQLKQWISERCVWCKTDKNELQNYTLKLFAARIFDDPEWVDYIQFNRRYRPEKIKAEQKKEDEIEGFEIKDAQRNTQNA